MDKKSFKVITLCGSTRFKDDFIRVQEELTLKGNIVLIPGIFSHSSDKRVWEGMSEGAIAETKNMLDEMHKRKIDMSDTVYIINPGGYIGSSTESELRYAISSNKEIMSLEPIDLDRYRFKSIKRQEITLRDFLFLYAIPGNSNLDSSFNNINTNNKSFPDKYRRKFIHPASFFRLLSEENNPDRILDRAIDYIALLPSNANIDDINNFSFILDVEYGFRRFSISNGTIELGCFLCPVLHIVLKEKDIE